jgi:eukaryotic-like serine/threonine-protein kinase
MSERAPTSDPFGLIGTTIQDKYRIVSAVGTGGFGVVYRGVHTGFGEPIAIKCLKLPAELDPEQRAKLLTRLQDEGRVLHRLSRLSSGIVQALDVGAVTTAHGQWVPYLVLEWLEGQTLAEWVKERRGRGENRMTLAEAVELLEPAARALGVAHEQKVAHRDVKPDNLVLTDVSGKRTLKILDFGIAKVLAQSSEFTAAAAATQKAATAFTPSYGAPEQFNKKRGATGPWTDVFGLALILVELVSGERALDGDDATQLYIAAADPAARPTLRYRGVSTSDAVETVMQRALAVDPHDRYPDAGSFWGELRAALRSGATGESSPVDVSETGEFVSKHAMGLEPEALSRIDRALGVEPAASAAGKSAQPAGPLAAAGAVAAATGHPSDAPGSTSPDDKTQNDRAAAAGADGRTDAAPTVERGSGAASSANVPRVPRLAPSMAEDEVAAAASGVAKHDSGRMRPERAEEPAPPSSTPDRRVSWWMPVVAILALAGAGFLYVQLRAEDQAGPDGSSGARTAGGRTGTGRSSSVHKPGTDATGRSTDSTSPSGAPSGSGAAGSASAAVDGGPPDGGTAHVFPPPPEGMVFVPGAPPGEPPTAARGLFIDRTEVTTKSYRECVLAGRCVRASRVVLTEEVANRIWGKPTADPNEPTQTPEELAKAWGKRCNELRGELDHPINCVNFASAQDYCQWKGHRLPTSAEWTLAAAGAGPARPFPWGADKPECAFGCYGRNGSCVASTPEVVTCAVGSRPRDSTPEGVLDLGGNVAEWTADEVPASSPQQPALRMVRGGSFSDEAERLTSATGEAMPPVTAFVTIGFRCAADAPEGYLPPGR